MSKIDSVEGETVYSYDGNDRLLSESINGNVTSYSYDNNGNTLSRIKDGTEQVIYTWDGRNRLIGADVITGNNSSHSSYRYNHNGIRIAEIVDGVETRYLIDENQSYAQGLEEYDAEENVHVSYVYGRYLISQDRGGVQSFYLVDGLGSTRILIDSNGEVIDSYNYEAFGELIGSSGTTENSYLFAGEQFDENLGDYYLRARYYDTDTGRFTRRDSYEGSLNDPVTLHKYLYGNGNPVNFTDPSGYISQTELFATLEIADILLTVLEFAYNPSGALLDVALLPFDLIGVPKPIRHLQKLISNPCSIGVKSGLLEMSIAKGIQKFIGKSDEVVQIGNKIIKTFNGLQDIEQRAIEQLLVEGRRTFMADEGIKALFKKYAGSKKIGIPKNADGMFSTNGKIGIYEVKKKLTSEEITDSLKQLETTHVIVKEIIEKGGESIPELADDGLVIMGSSMPSGRYSVGTNNILLDNGEPVQRLGKFVRVELIN